MCIFYDDYTWGAIKWTNIDIDDALLDAAMTATGLATKKEAAVDRALRSLVERHRRKNALADLAGIGWERDLGVRRRDRPDDKL
ncbi:type II toxin-antitoxin system VapB family antitoxin [Rhizobium leguminosarum]|uniref:type II toxin-antitoxin system VapB family antitoxin n=1 Tax=Rhizobium leguminosarum TaxID=384 RepID=UPI001AEB2010|nr:type II toxin-antitoxin system VapB family antitoxin [Rhizobium leguminosarum]MBP2486995.1 Arc/MetJ family transcription regulator [Rhizobium leguminosarum]